MAHRLQLSLLLAVLLSSAVPSLRADDMAAASICLATADNRYTAAELALGTVATLDELRALWELHSGTNSTANATAGAINTASERALALFINRRFALVHGHPLFVSNGSELEAANATTPGRHASWNKLALLRVLQRAHPECAWFFWLDSDAYLWMNGHTTSLLHFARLASVHELTHDFAGVEAARLNASALLPWHGRALVVGLNGYDSQRAGIKVGYPHEFMSDSVHYVCAGTFLVANGPHGQALLAAWDGADGAATTGDGAASFQQFAGAFPWEQAVLARYILPRWRTSAVVYSYLTFGWHEGPFIRHVWNPLRRDPGRTGPLIREAAEALFGQSLAK